MPQSTVEVGATGVTGDTRYFGMFNGMADDGLYAIADADVALREDATGTWMWFTAHNLGLDSRELGFSHERQGDWRYFIDLSQFTFRNPLEITTGLTGIGKPDQSVSGTALREVDLETKREQLKTGFTKRLGRNLDVKMKFRHEEKRGERQWGAQGFNFLTEPVDFVTREVTGTADYTGRRLQLSGGYIGSFFTSAHEVLDNDSSQPRIALPPDNSAHQVHLAGAYALTPTTRATFKASYGIAIQDETFFTAPTFGGNTRGDLGGQVNTTLVQLGLTARPMRKLAVNAKLRYDDRDDRTDRAQYITASASRSGFNIPFSRTTLTGDLEAIYSLPQRFRVIGRLKQENWNRSKPVLRQASFRDDTYETSYGIELRRPLMHNLGGSISYTRSVKNGSRWHDGTDGAIDAINLADRERDKVRLSLSWVPQERLTAQLSLEYSDDVYDSRPLGPRDGSTLLASLDVGYQLSQDWNVNAWTALSDFRLDQASNGDGTAVGGGAITDEDWAADLQHLGIAAGFGVRGRLTDSLTTGAEAQYSTDRSKHELTGLDASVIPNLPDIRYRQASVGLFLDYKISASRRIRLNYGYSRIVAKDWTWESWTFADGTTIEIPGREETHFIGIAYSHRW
ncbi:MAG: MtrB/PioB family decaheme-associated outer membrane protein [Alphaproteobacteria bacterium]|nr:MtrB/PioB family decaheme-associated outer membrane protein [Alphaproteobacteria bacterium]